jgi:predicted transposase YbfD/YdcC
LEKAVSLIEHFLIIPDPRIDRHKKHNLIDIIVLAICGVISDCDTWVEIEEFSEARIDWFKQFLELPNGIPSHDTFGRVFSMLDPDAFLEAFITWVSVVNSLSEGEIIAIDGKAIRAVFDRSAPHGVVSAWASRAGVSLGQRAIGAHEDERDAFKRMIDILHLKGCIVTMDAAGCHSNITNRIVEKKGDFVVAIKANQKTLLRQLTDALDGATELDEAMTEEKGHGRREKRTCQAMKIPTSVIESLEKRKEQTKANTDRSTEQWLNLESVCRIVSEREVKGKKTQETRYYITSLEGNAKKLLECARSHWEVENKLHYVLDMAFDEDHCRARNKFAMENFALLRRFALNLVRHEKTPKKSIRVKRKKASWDPAFMMQIVQGAPTVGI